MNQHILGSKRDYPISSPDEKKSSVLQSALDSDNQTYSSFPELNKSMKQTSNSIDSEDALNHFSPAPLHSTPTENAGSPARDESWNEDQNEGGWEGMPLDEEENVNFVPSTQRRNATTDTKDVEASDDEKEGCIYLQVRNAVKNKDLQVTCSWQYLRKEYTRAVLKKFKLKTTQELLSDVSDEELMWWRYRKCQLETYDDQQHIAEIRPNAQCLDDLEKEKKRIWIPYKCLVCWKM